MSPASYCVVATFDNTDPIVFGPYPSLDEAKARVQRCQDGLYRSHGHHLESVTARFMARMPGD